MEEKEAKKENAPLVMTIVLAPNGSCQVNFPFLKDKIATYGFLKFAEKTIDEHYRMLREKANEKKIVQPKGAMMDFVRNLKS